MFWGGGGNENAISCFCGKELAIGMRFCFSIFLSRIIMISGPCPGPVIILERNIESNVKNLAETRVLARASSFYNSFGTKKRANAVKRMVFTNPAPQKRDTFISSHVFSRQNRCKMRADVPERAFRRGFPRYFRYFFRGLEWSRGPALDPL